MCTYKIKKGGSIERGLCRGSRYIHQSRVCTLLLHFKPLLENQNQARILSTVFIPLSSSQGRERERFCSYFTITGNEISTFSSFSRFLLLHEEKLFIANHLTFFFSSPLSRPPNCSFSHHFSSLSLFLQECRSIFTTFGIQTRIHSAKLCASFKDSSRRHR
jgi:hypothetical protein